ncbi:MAG: metal-dependent hydrolase [Deltaproteobacteria bacterium]|nr:metal-dependent hydrolase [Deltaproteobacteria bacterium]
MKGLTHFISGAAAATFFPEAVQMAVQDKSFILLLGGAAGILPDTLDFKFARFFHTFDVDIAPDPLRPDAQQIADAIAAGLERAAREKRRITLKLHTMKLSANMFRRYTVRWLQGPAPGVEVEIGPAVTMSKDPVVGYEPVPAEIVLARAALSLPVTQDKHQDQVIDTFGGPDMAFTPRPEALWMDFIPWHRHWSHSLVLGGLIGALVWGVAALAGFHPAWLYGAIAALGFNVHVLEDQLGVMGSNLWWPFPGQRIPGKGFMHSGDAFPNFFFVWLSAVLLLWNLNRFSLEPPLPLWSFDNPGGWRFEIYFLYLFVLPITAIHLLDGLFRRFAHREEEVTLIDPKDREAQFKDMKDEAEEGFGG